MHAFWGVDELEFGGPAHQCAFVRLAGGLLGRNTKEKTYLTYVGCTPTICMQIIGRQMQDQFSLIYRLLFAMFQSSGYPKRLIDNYTEVGDETNDGGISDGGDLRRTLGRWMCEKRAD